MAAKAGRVPVVLASNTNSAENDATLAELQRLFREGVIRHHFVIERGGIRFGLFGVLGKEAQFYTSPGAASFSDAIEAAEEMVKVLRETEKVDVIVALSHGGVEKGKDGRYSEGDDVRLPQAVPGIDVVIGGHSHRAHGGDPRQRPHAGCPDRKGRTESRRAGSHRGRRRAYGRVLSALPDRRQH